MLKSNTFIYPKLIKYIWHYSYAKKYKYKY